MLISRDMAIFVLTTTTTITLPLAHARGVRPITLPFAHAHRVKTWRAEFQRKLNDHKL